MPASFSWGGSGEPPTPGATAPSRQPPERPRDTRATARKLAAGSPMVLHLPPSSFPSPRARHGGDHGGDACGSRGRIRPYLRRICILRRRICLLGGSAGRGASAMTGCGFQRRWQRDSVRDNPLAACMAGMQLGAVAVAGCSGVVDYLPAAAVAVGTRAVVPASPAVAPAVAVGGLLRRPSLLMLRLTSV
jgi:hypothetical protein